VTWGCWHNYQPDTDGTVFCTLCGDCPDERERERTPMNNLFTTRDKHGDTLTVDQFELASGRRIVMARVFDSEGCLEGSCQLDLHALVRLSNALNQQLPGLVEAG
jgi:hypothetical protein